MTEHTLYIRDPKHVSCSCGDFINFDKPKDLRFLSDIAELHREQLRSLLMNDHFDIDMLAFEDTLTGYEYATSPLIPLCNHVDYSPEAFSVIMRVIKMNTAQLEELAEKMAYSV